MGTRMYVGYDFGQKTGQKNNFFCMKGKIFILSGDILSLMEHKIFEKFFSTNVVFRPWVQKFLQNQKKSQKFSPNFFTLGSRYHDYVVKKLAFFFPEASNV